MFSFHFIDETTISPEVSGKKSNQIKKFFLPKDNALKKILNILKSQRWKYLKTWGSLSDVLSFLVSCSYEPNLLIFSLRLSVVLQFVFYFFLDFRFETTLKCLFFISIFKVAWLCVDIFQFFPFLQSSPVVVFGVIISKSDFKWISWNTGMSRVAAHLRPCQRVSPG